MTLSSWSAVGFSDSMPETMLPQAPVTTRVRRGAAVRIARTILLWIPGQSVTEQGGSLNGSKATRQASKFDNWSQGPEPGLDIARTSLRSDLLRGSPRSNNVWRHLDGD